PFPLPDRQAGLGRPPAAGRLLAKPPPAPPRPTEHAHVLRGLLSGLVAARVTGRRPPAACRGRRDRRAGTRARRSARRREVHPRHLAARRARGGAARRQRRPARRPADLRLLRATAARRAAPVLARSAADVARPPRDP